MVRRSVRGSRGGLRRHVRNRRASRGGRVKVSVGLDKKAREPLRRSGATEGGPPGPGAAPRIASGWPPRAIRGRASLDAKGRCPILLRSVRSKPDGAPGKIRRALRPLAQRWPSDRPARARPWPAVPPAGAGLPGRGRPWPRRADGGGRGPAFQPVAASCVGSLRCQPRSLETRAERVSDTGPG